MILLVFEPLLSTLCHQTNILEVLLSNHEEICTWLVFTGVCDGLWHEFCPNELSKKPYVGPFAGGMWMLKEEKP
jgi:hypothetical protein